MAWKDARRHPWRLLMYFFAITTGVAVLTAIETFRYNIKKDFDAQTLTLIGADFTASINQIPTQRQLKLLDTIPVQPSREISFASMIYIPGSGKSRLMQVRALEGQFPYYGEIETEPAGAMQRIKQPSYADGSGYIKGPCVVDKTVLMQFGLHVGDTIKVGNDFYLIEGALLKAPGQTGITATVAPVVYVGYHTVQQSGLIQKGSRVFYRYYYKMPSAEDAEALAKKVGKIFQKENINYETAETRKKNLDNSFRDFINYLNLVGFVAVILGGIAVSTSVQVHIRNRLNNVAILRCLGLPAKQAFFIYLMQILLLSAAAALIGVFAGTAIQNYFPVVFGDFFPVEISTHLSWSAIISGLFTGTMLSTYFALPALLRSKNITPLAALRGFVDEQTQKGSRYQHIIYLSATLLLMWGFAYWKTADLKQSAFFTGLVVAAYFTLSASTQKIIITLKKWVAVGTPFYIKTAVSNLLRPGNQSALLITALGLGVTLLSLLQFTKELLIREITISEKTQQPNLILFDIRPEQLDTVKLHLQKHQLPLVQEVPIILAELKTIKGIPTYVLRMDSTSKIPRWTLNREYRITYRKKLLPSEKITDGTWTDSITDLTNPIPISLEADYARSIQVGVGDSMLFNVQGVEMPCVVGSIRRITWNRVQSNFLVVFPAGVLEQAPKIWSLVSRTDSAAQSAAIQAWLSEKYPNISTIDLALILDTIELLIAKISIAIQFLGLFCLITGVVVLITSIYTTKYQRIREVALLRTLGAGSHTIRRMILAEFAIVGVIAGALGVVLGGISAALLAHYFFNNTFTPSPASLMIILAFTLLFTMLVGWATTVGIARTAPWVSLKEGD